MYSSFVCVSVSLFNMLWQTVLFTNTTYVFTRWLVLLSYGKNMYCDVIIYTLYFCSLLSWQQHIFLPYFVVLCCYLSLRIVVDLTACHSNYCYWFKVLRYPPTSLISKLIQDCHSLNYTILTDVNNRVGQLCIVCFTNVIHCSCFTELRQFLTVNLNMFES